MKRVYVIGGKQRLLRSLLAGSWEWYEYERGLILSLNLETHKADVCVEYVSPPEACAQEEPVILFKSGTVQDNKLYVCTQTEVLIYTLPDFTRVGYISLPSFNDLHHVRPTPHGTLVIANTGLDMVVEVSCEGTVLREWGVLGEDVWQRFSRAVDYRKGIRTKPHKAHPNYVFYVGEDLWVTRFEQKDAVCLTRSDRPRIVIGTERPHDGIVQDGYIYFTTVNGNIVIVNQNSLKIEEIVDLNEIHDDSTLLGWCRSIMICDGKAWVGFSRLRPTKFRDNVSWVKNGFKHIAPTHLAYYDLVRKRHLAQINLEDQGLNAVFSIFPKLE